MSADVTEFVGKLYKASAEIKTANREAVKVASLAAKETMLAGAATVRTPKVINTAKGKRKNAFGVRFLWYTTEQIPRTVVYYWGAPPYWRERGTSDHDIKPRKGTAALLIGEDYAKSAHVHGVAARPFWTPTKEAAHRRVMPIVQKGNLAALVKAGYR